MLSGYWFQVTAAPMGKEQVSRAVETWVRSVTADGRPDAVVADLEPYPAGETPAAYIVHLAGGGLCLAGADSLVLPVYLYSPKAPMMPAIRVPGRSSRDCHTARTEQMGTGAGKTGHPLVPTRRPLRNAPECGKTLLRGSYLKPCGEGAR